MLFVFFAEADHLIEQDGVLLIGFKAVLLIFRYLLLEHLPHRAQFKISLSLQTLDEGNHLCIVVLADSQFVSHFRANAVGQGDLAFE